MKKNAGYICPKCGAWEVYKDDFEMDIDCLWVQLHCSKCGELWSEYYSLIYDGYVHSGIVYNAEGKECIDT